MNDCIKIIKFNQKNNYYSGQKTNYLDFSDAIYIMTVNKIKIQPRQYKSIKNINLLGCSKKTYWCLTKPYKDCNFIDINHNILTNALTIIHHALENNFDNIIIFEDDFICNKITINNLQKKKKKLNDLIYQNKNQQVVIYLGFIPLTIKKIDHNVITGRFGNGHALLLNKRIMKRILKYPNINFNKNHYFKIGSVTKGLDELLYLDQEVKHLALTPNDLFFQESDIYSNTGSKKNMTLQIFYRIQQLFTGKLYYQYSQDFSNIYEKFIKLISFFFNERDPAIIILHNKTKNIFGSKKILIVFISLIIIVFIYKTNILTKIKSLLV